MQALRPAEFSLVGLMRFSGSRTGRRQDTCIQLGRGFTAAMGTEMRQQRLLVVQGFSFVGHADNSSVASSRRNFCRA